METDKRGTLRHVAVPLRLDCYSGTGSLKKVWKIEITDVFLHIPIMEE